MPAVSPPWFRRHPLWTLVLAVLSSLVLVVGGAVGTEVMLRRADRSAQRIPQAERVMRFREMPLNADLVPRPDQGLLAGADGLADLPVHLQTDADGFILPARRHAVPDRTVLFLGSSTTACVFVPDSLRIHALAAQMLEDQTGLRINTLNAARTGNHAVHSLALFLGKGVPQDPDVVVMSHAANDLTTLLRSGDYWNDDPSRGLLLSDPCRTPGCHLRLGFRGLGAALFPALGRRLRSDRETPVPTADSAPGPVDSAFLAGRFRGALVDYVETARAWGVTPVLMTQANRFTPQPQPTLVFPHDGLGLTYSEFRALYVAFNEVTRAVAADLGVPLVDLAAVVPQDAEHLFDYVHLTAAGSRRVAEAVAKTLVTLPSITSPGAPPP